MKRPVFVLRARQHRIRLGHATKIMGIVNCTPDSFSGDGRLSTRAALHYARQLIRQGADILDIGGESTRPGAKPVSVKEELTRVIPVIQALAKNPTLIISVDTSKVEVAHAALKAGASIVNNVRGHQLSKDFLKVVREQQAALVIMHMRGEPGDMVAYARYNNVVKEVVDELKISVEKCKGAGIKKDRIILDPGIGFAKNLEHNLSLLAHLDALQALGFPVLLGTSRKSFIGKLIADEKSNRLMGTAASVVAGVMNGAHLVRVHDVGAMKETLKVTDAILTAY